MQMNSSNDACSGTQVAQIPDALQRLEVAVGSLGEALDALRSKIDVACLEKPVAADAQPCPAEVEMPRCLLAQRVFESEERINLSRNNVQRMLEELEL